MERREIHFSGHVQGVGFRYTTRNVASRFAVTGFVRNLSDGRVHVVVEGTKSELNRFMSAVEETMSGHIREKSVDVLPSNGEFDSFQIRF